MFYCGIEVSDHTCRKYGIVNITKYVNVFACVGISLVLISVFHVPQIEQI